MLAAKQLGKKYKASWALEPLTIELAGGMYGLLGPNGAGKSTFMKLLGGLLAPTTGEALLGGVPVRDLKRARSRIGYVPQSFRMYPQLTAREWLLHAARLRNFGTRVEQELQVRSLLASLNLERYADLPARTYSSGMVKRLGIAQSLVGDPAAIIVDEPTAGLDPEERLNLRNTLAELAMTRVVLFSTHVLSDIEASCREVIVLQQGKLRYNGQLSGLARFAQDRLWQWEASEREWRSLAQEALVFARKTADGVVCRMINSRQPTPYAELVTPTMEEGYLALIGNEEDGMAG
ncbi:ABC-type multidrug transport system ATPase subunit [Paenibacillus phyllosphaerae]|uniref:ABC-type multidrug transport system ATPase subunit n=1 Tax=Paenibacillus phyllosphaerae TaxID=274593 RepID=A0A7W5FRI3_9BACL|nr:ATP-binding cassette domain-containing protein [Paenibacillus phyllosphaerae]MBB3114373.1 ABC-type multidrug transport system ATPase subunit [Paenibacillus phyllosphaerae]